MSDLPGGRWSPLLIGHQWPGSETLAALAASAENRAATAAAHHEYAETLRSIRMGLLADQQGVAAESARRAFQAGEDSARGTVDGNETKRDSYLWAHRHIAELRSILTDIARNGNAEIRLALDSQLPISEKVSGVVRAILAAQTHANTKAAECTANLLSVIEPNLVTAQIGLSAREFSSANGVDLLSAFQPSSPESLHSQIETVLGESGGQHPPDSVAASTSAGSAPPGQVPSAPTVEAPYPRVPLGSTTAELAAGQIASSPSTAVHSAGEAGRLPTVAQAGPEAAADHTPRHGALRAGADVLAAGLEGPGFFAPISEPPPPTAAETPADRTQVSTDPFTMPNAAGNAPPGFVAPGSAFLVSGPAVAQGMPPLPPHTGAPAAGPASLPVYGSDLRPPTAATAPVPPQPAATPGAAPVGAATTSGSTGQPVLVRRTADLKTDLPDRATTAGAVAMPSGAARSGPGSGNLRLRLLHCLARQQPQLRWAVGDLDGDHTVAVTDLAGGWIPPGIDIPAGVHLVQPREVQPRERTGDLASLLGPATSAVTYEPGQHLPPDKHRVALSRQTRQSTRVGDLGWELAQATRWRDGLPRLAHTLTLAASARSGYLSSEIDLLREHLSAVTSLALNRYRSGATPVDVGNWQLLAAIESLITGELADSHYHLAWFSAQDSAAQTTELR